MVRLVSALSVIVLRIGPVTANPTPGLVNVAVTVWLSPSSVTVVIVPAAVVLAPFASRILTAPSMPAAPSSVCVTETVVVPLPPLTVIPPLEPEDCFQ